MKIYTGEPNKIIQSEKIQDQSRKLRLKETAENIEAIFLNFMLKSMMKISDERNSIFGGDDFGTDVLDGIFYIEMSRHLAKNGKFGIEELIYKELEKRDAKTTSDNSGQTEKATMKEIPKHQGQRRKFIRYNEPVVEKINRFDDIIKKASSEFNIPEELIKAIIAVESSGDIFALSPKGAKGLMQLIDSTAQFVGIKNIWHPAENIYGGVKYLRHLLDRFNGDIKLALAGYNAGPENVERFGGIPPFPETIEYVGKVMRYLKLFEQKGGKNDTGK
jgi:Rod binding domain-containing protein